ncbi:TIGR02253 family HAD-type hydrolase [Thermococcus thioreducens]|uniref:2-haloalkanoic acid dehalogenase n=1 Tax=Thermococcus thioreducens TaxID=277988 RepID=A0A0Q2RBY4_9EURY|nr:TIGR02253 family HAD-type hydrolase [Thermococcus thioreducens]ASJ13002.1 2-haloalkanoic acid dehalogenase [Thermococcus thioreducens]KQH81454.1 2-haloalkanoic acid dehalogenase [Thermococcus thioreducens]SEV82443.1 putative hydrolase of the HAD superfamily [Thermococcus thioreducens]
MKAVFFDFVGTLITKEGENVTHQNIVREVLKKAGREDLDYMRLWEEYEAESSAMFKELAGKPYVKIRDVDTRAMRKVAERYGFTVPEDFWEISIAMHERYGGLFPDAVETVKALKDLGLHVGIITDSDNDYIEAHLKALGIYGLFDSITTSEDAGFYKPHEGPFLLALERAGVEAGEAIYVGDNPSKDCVGAKKVGMMSVLLDLNGEKRGLWRECDFVVSKLDEVVEIVRSLMESRSSRQ